jgi:hypothetical protein
MANPAMGAKRPALLLHEIDAQRDASPTRQPAIGRDFRYRFLHGVIPARPESPLRDLTVRLFRLSYRKCSLRHWVDGRASL